MTRYQRCLINAAILKNLGASGLVLRQIMLTVSDAAKVETATWADRVSTATALSGISENAASVIDQHMLGGLVPACSYRPAPPDH